MNEKCEEKEMKVFSFGERVLCRGFLKKFSKNYYLPRIDLEDYSEKQMNIISKYSDKVIFVEPNDSIRSLEFETIERTFSGIIVGYQNVCMEIDICCESYENEFNDLKYYIYKHNVVDKVVKCAIVYYGVNRKRLVPLKFLENYV